MCRRIIFIHPRDDADDAGEGDDEDGTRLFLKLGCTMCVGVMAVFVSSDDGAEEEGDDEEAGRGGAAAGHVRPRGTCLLTLPGVGRC